MNTEKAYSLLQETARAPHTFCQTKEALLARCSAILEMVDVFEVEFYARHLAFKGHEVDEQYTSEWAAKVLEDAHRQLSRGHTR